VLFRSPSGATHVQLDGNETMLEYDRQNNQLKTSGLFKRVEPITFKFATRLDNPEKTEVFWFPVAAWNEQNNFMAGVNLHNTTLPGRDWEFSVTPLYSFSQNNINGFARLTKYMGKHKLDFQLRKFTSLDQGLSFNSFNYNSNYIRPSISFNYILQDNPRSRYKDQLIANVSGIYLTTEVTSTDEFNNSFIPSKTTQSGFVPMLRYEATFDHGPRLKHAFGATARAFFEPKLSPDIQGIILFADYQGEFRYNKNGKKVRWKGFTGISLDENLSYQLSGLGRTASNDIVYDQLFLARQTSNEFLTRQIANDQESVLVNHVGYKWILNGMLEFEIPKTPLSVWASGSVSESRFFNYQEFLGINYSYSYASGISFTLVRDVMAVHMPLINPQLVNATKYEPWDYLTFQFNIDKLNPWSALRKIGQ